MKAKTVRILEAAPIQRCHGNGNNLTRANNIRTLISHRFASPETARAKNPQRLFQVIHNG